MESIAQGTSQAGSGQRGLLVREARVAIIGSRKRQCYFSRLAVTLTMTALKAGVLDWGSSVRGTSTLASGKYIKALPGLIASKPRAK